MKYRVMVTEYGFAVIEANSEKEALEIADEMEYSDFDWTGIEDSQIVEEVKEEE